jgi:queuine tRNA-ribosyltransferase
MYNIKDFGNKPIFMPDATRGAVRYVTTEQLKQIDVQGVVVNTLHLLITIGPDRIQRLGGMHKFMNWDRYILSDSGGFQVFSLLHSKKWKGKIHENGADFKAPIDGTTHSLTPESSIDIQIALDSDVLVTLDDCRDAQISREEAELSVDRTIKWAERAKNHFEKRYGGTSKTGKLLSCVVQGANFIDLRVKCAEELTKIGFDGYNFGGYVIDAAGNLVKEEMQAVFENTPQDKFHYAMGVGKPQDILDGLEIGYKVFDTVLVTRNARHGTLYSFDMAQSDGYSLRIKNAQYAEDQTPIDSTCDCEACKHHSRAYFHNLIKSDEAAALSLMSIHNLRFYMRLLAGQAIL